MLKTHHDAHNGKGSPPDPVKAKPVSPLRPFFLLNLFALIVLGTAACGWVLYFTSWFPQLGGLLALGGLFSWLAFVFKLIPDDTVNALRNSFAQSLDHVVILVAIALIGGAMYWMAWVYGAIRVEAHQGTIPLQAWVYTDNPRPEPVSLSADGESNLVVDASKVTTRQVKILGRPSLSVPVAPRHRHPLLYPESFDRHVLLLVPSAALINKLWNIYHKVRLEVVIRDPKRVVVQTLRIPNYDWYPFWAGCADDVALTDYARGQLASEAKGIDQKIPVSGTFSFAPLSNAKWYDDPCTGWKCLERALPEDGFLEVIIYPDEAGQESALGMQKEKIRADAPGFIQVVRIGDSFFRH